VAAAVAVAGVVDESFVVGVVVEAPAELAVEMMLAAGVVGVVVGDVVADGVEPWGPGLGYTAPGPKQMPVVD
jgi:hypothetical protein